MKILVTGADGFVGSWLVPHLVDSGHEIVSAIRPGEVSDEIRTRRDCLTRSARVVELELCSAESIATVLSEAYDAVVHLAAVASVADASRDAELAWRVNTLGTALLAEQLARSKSSRGDPVVLYVSTAEVYGAGPASPRIETDPVRPISRYAASKLGGELAALEVHRRTGLRVVIARAFGHTGPRQASSYVVPSFAQRILSAKKVGAPVVAVGNLEPVREFLHVADVVDAYGRLLEHGEPGEVYNVASGEPIPLREVFNTLAEAAQYRVVSETDSALVRAMDIPYLSGDSAKLRRVSGWTPKISLEQTLAEVMNAQAH